jgi:hypothetical protein
MKKVKAKCMTFAIVEIGRHGQQDDDDQGQGQGDRHDDPSTWIKVN